jgi:predicted TIM-barrel fold metal-dependent hydrolase
VKYCIFPDKHGCDRVLYGSGCPLGSQRISLETFKSLPMLEDRLDKLLCKNALTLPEM